jgi:hypothetical protein
MRKVVFRALHLDIIDPYAYSFGATALKCRPGAMPGDL